MVKKALLMFFGVFSDRKTYLNLAYLLAGSVCGLIDFILFSTSLALVLGLTAIPIWLLGALSLDLADATKALTIVAAGILSIPASLLLWFFPALLEQRLAGWLLDLRFSVRVFWAGAGSIPAALLRYVASGVAWRRLLFGVLRIPLGFVSFLAVLIVAPAGMAFLSMPAVFLAGYRDLIVWKWRIDSVGESAAVFAAALLLAPLALHAMNWLSRASAGLARFCLQD